MFNNLKLKILMIENDIKGFELAEKVGVLPAAVSCWLQGKQEPRPDMLPKLSKIFKIEQREFIK